MLSAAAAFVEQFAAARLRMLSWHGLAPGCAELCATNSVPCLPVTVTKAHMSAPAGGESQPSPGVSVHALGASNHTHAFP